MTVRRKLILAFLAVTVLPFAALVVGLSGPAVREGERLVGGRLEDNVQQAARSIDQFMINCMRDMKAFAADLSGYVGDTKKANQFLDRLTYFYPYFQEFTYADVQGTIVASSDGQLIGKSLFDLYGGVQLDFENAIKGPEGPVYILQLVHSEGTRRDMRLQMFAAVFDRSGKCLGVIAGYLVMQHLRDLLADIDRRIPGDRFSALLDRNGEIVMSNYPDEVTAPSGAASKVLLSELQQGGKNSGFVTYTDAAGERIMSGYTKLWSYGANRAGDWRLVASAPYDLIMGPVRGAIMHGAIILIVGIAVAALIGYWLAHALAQPILQLTEGVRRIAKGDLNARVRVATRDETGELANSFNAMADTIQDQIAALQAANDELETRVDRRTRELAKINADLNEEVTFRKSAQALLEAAQSELADTSRRAGMAEVATSVLHNVGNVLNSVNVTTTLVSDRILNSKATNIGKVAAMLENHKGDLARFMTEDPRGRQIPAYLLTLAAHLDEEQSAITDELNSLRNNVDHIKDIITMQQSYAKVYGVTEVLPPSALIEDALRLNAESIARNEIQVVREFDQVPEISVERHKVLQILVNLIRNAKHACDDSGNPRKIIRVRLQRDKGCISISVADNGVGIPPENITRIFNHGFTTREKGHGFGLHNSAIVARDLGGSLSATSDGVGKGAIFTLCLPLNPERPSKAHEE